MSNIRSANRNTNTFQIHSNSNGKTMSTTGEKTKDTKRIKLREILIEKFMKKFGVKNPLPILNEEITNFLKDNNLTDKDLKRLEERVYKILSELRNQETVRNGLISSDLNAQLTNNFKETDNQSYHPKSKSVSEVILPELNVFNHNDAMSVKSKHSRMSGASHLSKFDEDNTKVKNSQMAELEFLQKKEPRTERLNFTDQGDEWNAIVSYNQQLHADDKIQNKRKDLDVKRRIREDLDNQVRMKYKRKHEEKLKEKEFDKVLLDHCDYLSDLEIIREEEYKEKVMKDKENRDKQLIDEKKKKAKRNYKRKEI